MSLRPAPVGGWIDPSGLRALRLAIQSISAAGGSGTPSGWWASVADGAKSDVGVGSGVGSGVGVGAGIEGRRTGAGRADRAQPAPEQLARIEALVQLAQAGDAEAFGQIYEAYVDVVYRYVYVRCGSHHLAEDLTAETFVRALRRLDSFTWTGKDIAAWFVTIARNLVVDHVKSSRYRMEVTTGELLDSDERAAAPETEVLERLRDRRLLEAVKQLKGDQQECIVLRFLQGLSLAETAAVLGRKENAVKQLQFRAVRTLHRLLDGDLADELSGEPG